MFKILGLFFVWYFKDAPRGILGIWRNFILFISNYFSIILLLKTLFAPWRRIAESYGRGFDFGRFISTLTLNLFSRIIGFIIRSVVVAMGIAAEILVSILGAAIFIFWFFLPFVLVWAFWQGIILII